MVGMGGDTAVGDDERAPVAEEVDVVRADAVRRDLADALVAGRSIPDADATRARRVVVLRRVEQAAVA